MEFDHRTIHGSIEEPGPDYSHPEGRERFISRMWTRAPNGRFLEQDHAPAGFRTPNDHVWAHTLRELGFIEREPGVAWVTAYSRSQMAELGELDEPGNGNDDGEFDEVPLVRPRVKRPWPVLQLPKKHPANTDPPLGAIDGGCTEEHDEEDRTYTIRWDEFSDERKKAHARMMRAGCLPTHGDECKGRLIVNDTAEPVTSRDGKAYHYVWCEHFVRRLRRQEEPYNFVARVINRINQARIAADGTGLWLWDKPGEWKQYLPSQVSRRNDPLGKSALAISEDTIPGRPKVPMDLVLPNMDDVDESVNEDPEAVMDVDHAYTNPDAATRKDDAAPSLFSTKDLPKLEEFIPEALFPDTLLVHDPERVTAHTSAKAKPIRYKRIYPALKRDSLAEGSSEGGGEGESKSPSGEKTENVAELHLHPANRFGSGHHSYVYRAPLTLPAPLSARSPTGQCTVAAKLAYSRCTAHTLLHNEGEVYNMLPKHMQEEYCGFNIVPPCRFPVPVGAVVPKFYGYYLPLDEDGKVVEYKDERNHWRCDEDYPCPVDWMSPVLLIEECGEPVQPQKFTLVDACRTECFSLILRLHSLYMLQGSFYVRNVMCQPGPLTLPPEKRSFDTPSFRIIDFGRGRKYEKERHTPRSFACRLRDELEGARRELLLEKGVGF